MDAENPRPHLFECPTCGDLHTSAWAAADCHDPTIEPSNN